MMKYNVKESWECFGSELDLNFDFVHSLKQLKSYVPNKQPLCHEISSQKMCWCQNRMFIGVPLYVESLVSPHFHRQPETKRQAANTIKSSKNVVLPPADFSDAESREKVNNASANTSTSAGV